IRPDPRLKSDDFEQRHGIHRDHAAVRPQPHRRFGGRRRAGGDQRHAGAIADLAPDLADLPQDQSCRHADPAGIDDVRRAADHDGQRLCLLDPGAEGLASLGRRPRDDRRQLKSVDPNPAQPGPARRDESRFRNSPHCACEPDRRSADGFALRRSASRRAPDERPVDDGPRLRRRDRGLSQRRSDSHSRHRAGDKGARGYDAGRLAQRQAGCFAVRFSGTRRQCHVGRRGNQESPADVRFTLLLTIGLVVGVIALFLRKLWATVIPAISVPISLIGTFAVMYVLGYSLDNLSLMALTIAVGFVVDDAIVMVENIVRHVEGGASPLQAALHGAGEIGFTIVSISISLVAVFIPLFLMGGVVGLLFREFAVTVAVSILVSVLVSLTLTPMLCAKLLPAAAHGKEGRVSRALEAFFTWLVEVYDRALIVALKHRRITLGVMIATVATTIALFVVIPKGFFPQQDTGIIMGISEAAQDVSPEGMKQRQQAILEIAAHDPAVASAVGYIGPGGPTVTENDGRVFITLKPEGQRNVTADQVIARLTTALQPVQGMRLYMQAAQDITIGSRLSKTQYQYTLVDIDQDELNFYATKLLAKLQDLPELTAVASDQEAPGRIQKIQIDRAAAALFGITPATVDSTLYDAFGQRHIARIYAALNEYYVILEVNPQYQLGPNALQRIYVLSQNSTMVPLSQIASLTPAVAPVVVNHQGQFPSVTLSFNLAPDATIGAAVSAVQKTTRDLHLPPSIATSFQGNAQAFQSSLSTTPPLILAALFAVYIILGMLYESTIHPLTILSTLPSAGLGALLTLMLVGRPLDVIGIIGIILLIGIVKKNGIMLVDVALEGQRHEG